MAEWQPIDTAEKKTLDWQHAVLRCVTCGRHASLQEVWFRVFNTGRCACGDGLLLAYVPELPALIPGARRSEEGT